MDDPVTRESKEVRRESAEIKRSAEAVETSTAELTESADRRTILAGDRTLLAAERTYAAWIRTGLAALAAGIGARALVRDILPQWLGMAIGTVLILFAGFCLVAAIWRELKGTPISPHPDIKPIPAGMLVTMSLLLLAVAVAALVGIWLA